MPNHCTNLTESPWRTEDCQQRLQLILQICNLDAPEIVLVIDDTGDRKKGHHTDHAMYIGNLGIENGIVAVTAYWILSAATVAIMPRYASKRFAHAGASLERVFKDGADIDPFGEVIGKASRPAIGNSRATHKHAKECDFQGHDAY